VENYIKQAVFKGHLRPRQRIIEDDLARHLNVSRGTAREALLHLERDGLVVTTPRRGTFMRDISLREIEVIFKIRGKLEGLCVRYMREALTAEIEDALHQALRKMKLATARNDYEQAFTLDMEIHHIIWRSSGQPQLFRTLNTVMNPFMFMIARSYHSYSSMGKVYEDHEKYVEMILSAPLGRVERQVEKYFANLYRLLNAERAPMLQHFNGDSWLEFEEVDAKVKTIFHWQ